MKDIKIATKKNNDAIRAAFFGPKVIETDLMPFDLSPSISEIVLIISRPIPERKASREIDQVRIDKLPVIIPPNINGMAIDNATMELPIKPFFLPQTLYDQDKRENNPAIARL